MKRSDIVELAKNLMAHHRSVDLSQQIDRHYLRETGYQSPVADVQTGHSWVLNGGSPLPIACGEVSDLVVRSIIEIMRRSGELEVTVNTSTGNLTVAFINDEDDDLGTTPIPSGVASSIRVFVRMHKITWFNEQPSQTP